MTKNTLKVVNTEKTEDKKEKHDHGAITRKHTTCAFEHDHR